MKCGARDRWIGWNFRHQYDRLHLIANHSRFLILPRHHHHQNLASKVLSLCQRRINSDWVERFGFPLLRLETFVDATRFVGTIYQAANWHYVGETRGYQRLCEDYRPTPLVPKWVFVSLLRRQARAMLAHPRLNQRYQTGAPRMKLSAELMHALPEFFNQINEIKTAIPLFEALDIQGKTITADAWLTQRELARYLVERRSAHYHFTVKANQKTPA